MSGALADGRYHEITATLDPVTVQDHFLVPKRVKWESNPSQKRKVISVGIGSNHIAVVARDHKQRKAYLYTSGSNAYGQLGHGDTGCAGTNRHALLVKVCEFVLVAFVVACFLYIILRLFIHLLSMGYTGRCS